MSERELKSQDNHEYHIRTIEEVKEANQANRFPERKLIGHDNHAYNIGTIEEITEVNEANRAEFEIDHGKEESKQPKKWKPKFERFKNTTYSLLKVLIHIFVGSYFAFATYHYIDIEKHECSGSSPNLLCGIQFCSGYGFLVLLLGFIYIGIAYFLIFKPKGGKYLYNHYVYPFGKWWQRLSHIRIVSAIMLAVIFITIAVFLFFETKDEPKKLQSLVAPFFLILAGYVFSYKRSAIQWRTVICGIVTQFILGIICIRWEVGRKVFECFGNKVATFLAFTDKGSRFVFGDTIIDDGIFAFAILPVIFFFSFIISILHYLGSMQWVVMKLGWILQQMLGTTVCESVTAAANIFLGMSESPMLIRPYLKILTASEIHSIMVSGFATVSGTVLAAYLSFGASAAHLITSSVMAAPAALAFSKLYMPETEESKTTSKNIQLERSEDSSILDAASNGANNAIPIVLGIVANIIAFIAFIAFLNAIINWLGFLVGLNDINFEWIFSKLFIPLVWAMGVPTKDVNIVAKIVATKSIINEFVAYERLGEYIKNGSLDARSIGITTFAICGFANPGALGILIGSLSAMAPNRRNLITSVAFRAFIVGSIVCFVSASFAGILLQEEEETRLYIKYLNTLERKNVSIILFKNE